LIGLLHADVIAQEAVGDGIVQTQLSGVGAHLLGTEVVPLHFALGSLVGDAVDAVVQFTSGLLALHDLPDEAVLDLADPFQQIFRDASGEVVVQHQTDLPFRLQAHPLVHLAQAPALFPGTQELLVQAVTHCHSPAAPPASRRHARSGTSSRGRPSSSSPARRRGRGGAARRAASVRTDLSGAPGHPAGPWPAGRASPSASRSPASSASPAASPLLAGRRAACPESLTDPSPRAVPSAPTAAYRRACAWPTCAWPTCAAGCRCAGGPGGSGERRKRAGRTGAGRRTSSGYGAGSRRRGPTWDARCPYRRRRPPSCPRGAARSRAPRPAPAGCRRGRRGLRRRVT